MSACFQANGGDPVVSDLFSNMLNYGAISAAHSFKTRGGRWSGPGDLIIPDITKTSSNNCLMSSSRNAQCHGKQVSARFPKFGPVCFLEGIMLLVRLTSLIGRSDY